MSELLNVCYWSFLEIEFNLMMFFGVVCYKLIEVKNEDELLKFFMKVEYILEVCYIGVLWLFVIFMGNLVEVKMKEDFVILKEFVEKGEVLIVYKVDLCENLRWFVFF